MGSFHSYSRQVPRCRDVPIFREVGVLLYGITRLAHPYIRSQHSNLTTHSKNIRVNRIKLEITVSIVNVSIFVRFGVNLGSAGDMTLFYYIFCNCYVENFTFLICHLGKLAITSLHLKWSKMTPKTSHSSSNSRENGIFRSSSCVTKGKLLPLAPEDNSTWPPTPTETGISPHRSRRSRNIGIISSGLMRYDMTMACHCPGPQLN